jgi:hypothetical protein
MKKGFKLNRPKPLSTLWAARARSSDPLIMSQGVFGLICYYLVLLFSNDGRFRISKNLIDVPECHFSCSNLFCAEPYKLRDSKYHLTFTPEAIIFEHGFTDTCRSPMRS